MVKKRVRIELECENMGLLLELVRLISERYFVEVPGTLRMSVTWSTEHD